ncbi:MAG: cation:proton antiporter [bacterium]
MELTLFGELTVLVVFTVVVSIIMRFLKQPLIIGYIIVGLILGPYVLNIIEINEFFEVFSKIGIALLLFVVGLGLSPSLIKGMGKAALITGLGQILFTSILGFFIARGFGFDAITSLYIAIALTFSSTIIIMKLLSDKNEIESLHGRISIGFLLVQDVVAVAILVGLSSFTGQDSISTFAIFKMFFIASLLIIGLMFVSKHLMNKAVDLMAKSQELLLIFSIAWCLLISYIFYSLNFSLEIGALLSGVALSYSKFRYEIISKMKPLRDFFIIIFFISLGTQMMLVDTSSMVVPIVIFSLFILIGNPLIVVILMGILGYRKKTGFLSGLTVAQISEFSLILVAMGLQVGHLTQEVVSMVTYIGIITIAGSSYFITYSNKIYPFVSKFLSIFERKGGKIMKLTRVPLDKPEIVLFGFNRIGGEVIKSIEKISDNVLIVDYNPDVVRELSDKGYHSVYGDASDSELLSEIDFSNTKLVVSTIHEFETNALLVDKAIKQNQNSLVIVNSENIEDAIKLYDRGAVYVILPHLIGGHHVASIIEKHGFDKEKFHKEKKSHIEYLGERTA